MAKQRVVGVLLPTSITSLTVRLSSTMPNKNSHQQTSKERLVRQPHDLDSIANGLEHEIQSSFNSNALEEEIQGKMIESNTQEGDLGEWEEHREYMPPSEDDFENFRRKGIPQKRRSTTYNHLDLQKNLRKHHWNPKKTPLSQK